jgi:rhamnosyltransferase
MIAGETSHPCGPGSVCAVIVTFRSGSKVVPTYQSINPQVGRVIIVDNGSDIGTTRVLEDLTRESDGKTELIRNRSNLGVGAALNQGCRHAVSLGFDWVLLMDQDSIAAPAMVASLQNAWANHPDRGKVFIMAPRYEAGEGVEAIYLSFRGIWPKKGNFTPGVEYLEPTEAITSGSLVRTDAFRRIGYFTEELFIDFVDTEFCLRLAGAGFRIVVPRDVFLQHALGKASRINILGRSLLTLNHPPMRRYYISRNRLHLMKTYFSRFPSFFLFHLREAFIDLIRVFLLEENRWEKTKYSLRGIRDGIIGKLGPAKSESGTRDG